MRGVRLVAFLAALFFPMLCAAESLAVGPVKARLVAESTSIRPGTPFLVAVAFQMGPGWHIYWSNPGDTGLPTTIAWDLPNGFHASSVMWPAPHRFISQGLASYGYEREVSLLTRITPPASLPPEGVIFHARVSWLACQIECTPGKADLSFSLPVGPGAPIADKRSASLLKEAASMVPTAAPGTRFSSTMQGDRILLRADGLSVAPDATVYFVPSDPGVLAEGAAQNARVASGSVTVEMAAAAKQPGARRVRGVLVVLGQAGARGFDVDTAAVGDAGAAGARAGAAGAAGAFSSGVASGTAGAGSFLIALALAFVGGLILNLMPCVLPVVSLKILSFVRVSGESGGSAVRHGLLFAAGVLVSFWAIAGILVGLRAGGQLVGWGFQFQSPAVVAVTASLFFLIALNLLDVFELRLPIRVSAPTTGGGAGAFLSGLLATVVATPCTAPFMGGALGYALTQPPALGFGVFSALAVGLAAPYVILSAIPGLVKRIPKPGRWMVTLRQVLAFPMLGAVIWMLYVLYMLAGFPALMTLLSALLLAGLGVWIYGRWGGLDRSARSRLISASLAALLVLGGTAFSAVTSGSAPAAAAAQTAAAAPPAAAVADPAPGSAWESWSPQRVAELQAAGTPVFVDFTAKWCLTCQVNERVTLRAPAVERAFRSAGIATLKADWTDRSDEIARTLAAFGRAGVPVYVLYPRGAASPILLPELLTPGVVIEALDKLR
ncbi:MAG: protein-disulfide reductase DsbD family protein [Spirochaetia bacterium]